MFLFMESERLWFRGPEVADTPTLGRWVNDPRVRPRLGNSVLPTGEMQEHEWCQAFSNAKPGPRTDIVLLFGLRGTPLDKPVGSTGLHRINWVVGEAEWGIVIGEVELWNRGYGREVARRMLAYAFTSLRLNRVQLRVQQSNLAGIKAYEAAGFVREGVAREAAMGPAGLENLVLMSVLRSEFSGDQAL